MPPLLRVLTLACLVAAVAPLARADGPACPQLRRTVAAPAEWQQRQSPLPQERRNLRAGRDLYSEGAGNCVACHGRKGDGKGPLADGYDPPPRNFRCSEFLRQVTAGQMFWIIRNGSENTAMPGHATLSDEQIWQLVMYLQEFAR